MTREERDVIGLNVTNPDVTYLVDVIDMLANRGWLGTRIDVQVGGEMQGLPNLVLGGQGIVSSMGKRDAGVRERLERVRELEPAHADGAELADPVARGREPGGLEVENDERSVLEQGIGAPARERDGGSRADDSAISGGEVGQERSGQPLGDRRRRKEGAGGLDGSQRPLLLERLHQPVERVECELHLSDESEHMFVFQVSPGEAASRCPAAARGARPA